MSSDQQLSCKITWILARAFDASTARCSNSTSLSTAAIFVALCAMRSSSALRSAVASSSRRAWMTLVSVSSRFLLRPSMSSWFSRQ
uniref:Uncharacterized protein n=1 Tax=Arundo donax TaxID=35708 RepID=A0A0A9DA70_ARUDO